jgi:hypothetical protein
MWVAALFYLLSIYVAPLHSLTSRNGIERCYYVEKVKTTRLDCSLMRRSVDSARPHQSMRRRRGWDTNPFETVSPTTAPTTAPTPTRQCRTVIDKRLIRRPIHEKPMNPIVSAFKSPHFPDIETKRKIKCEWDVTGESNMKYWVKVRQQFLTPNSSDTTNCLYVKGKGTMCAGKVIPVITKKNKLFMKMTIDSAELDPVKGGLEGVYVEQDPSETGGISIARASTVEHPCEDDHQKTCYELSCSSTDSGPDLQLEKPIVSKDSEEPSVTTAAVNASTPTPKPEKKKTEVPKYRQNADFIEDIFRKFSFGRRKRRSEETPATSTEPTPTSTSCVEPYEEEDRCDMDPPDASDDSDEVTYKRYFYNTNNGECQEILVADASIEGNIFKTSITCQRTCSKHHSSIHKLPY